MAEVYQVPYLRGSQRGEKQEEDLRRVRPTWHWVLHACGRTQEALLKELEVPVFAVRCAGCFLYKF